MYIQLNIPQFSPTWYVNMIALISAPDYNRDVWCSVKPNLGLDFPNVSQLIEF